MLSCAVEVAESDPLQRRAFLVPFSYEQPQNSGDTLTWILVFELRAVVFVESFRNQGLNLFRHSRSNTFSEGQAYLSVEGGDNKCLLGVQVRQFQVVDPE